MTTFYTILSYTNPNNNILSTTGMEATANHHQCPVCITKFSLYLNLKKKMNVLLGLREKRNGGRMRVFCVYDACVVSRVCLLYFSPRKVASSDYWYDWEKRWLLKTTFFCCCITPGVVFSQINFCLSCGQCNR